MVRYLPSVAYGVITFIIVLISIHQQMENIRHKHEFEINNWIQEINDRTTDAENPSKLMNRFGCQSLLDCLDVIHSYDQRLDQRSTDSKTEAFETLIRLATALKDHKILHKWLLKNNIPNPYIEKIENKYNSKSLQDLSALYWTQSNDEFNQEVNGNPFLKTAFDSLPNDTNDLKILSEDIWIDINSNDRKPWNWGLF